MLALILAGLFVGVAVGLTGVGGGSLMTPLLILLFGYSPATAVGTDLLYAAGTKGFGTLLHGRRQTVDWPVVGLMAAGSLPAALLTVVWLHLVGLEAWVEDLMVATLAVTMAVTALLTFVRDRFIRWLQARMLFVSGKDPSELLAWRPAITVFGGVVLGVLVSLSSVGAGVLGTTMLLILYPEARAVRIVGTDIAHAVPLTLIAGLGHLTLGTTDTSLLGLLLLGSLPGIYIGTGVGGRLPDRALRPMVASVLLIVAVGMSYKTLHLG